MKTGHDTQLGAALRRLPVPDHRDGFFEAVWEGVDAELDRAGAPWPEPHLLRRPHWPAIPGARRPRLALAAAITIALAAAVVLFGVPAGKRVVTGLFGGSTAEGPFLPGPQPAGATTVVEVARIAQGALRSLHTVTADVAYWRGHPGEEPRFTHTQRVILAADRSSMDTGSDGQWGAGMGSYDAGAGVARGWGWAADPAEPSVWFYMEERIGTPPGEPDGDWLPIGDTRAGFRSSASQIFAAVALVARENPDSQATTGEFDGRPVWIVRCPVRPEAAPRDWELSVSVDQQTGLPVRIQWLADDGIVAEGRLTNVRVDGPVPADAFSRGLPTAAEVKAGEGGRLYLWVDLGTSTAVFPLPFDPETVAPEDVAISLPDRPGVREDHGFRRTSMDRVHGTIGRAALAPAWLPEGFELDQVAVKPEQRAPQGADAVARARAGTGIVMLRYRNGFQAITVSTRRFDGRVASERFLQRTDPFIGDEWPGRAHARTAVRLTGGAFTGATGAVVVAPLTIPHLWAVEDGMLLTVSGDASAAQLVKIAESIQAWSPYLDSSEPAGTPALECRGLSAPGGSRWHTHVAHLY